MRGKRPPGSLLEALHCVHELELFRRVLLLERGGVNPLPAFLLSPALGMSRIAVFVQSPSAMWSTKGVSPVPARPAIVDQEVVGERRKIEFRRGRLRLIIVIGHGRRSRT